MSTDPAGTPVDGPPPAELDRRFYAFALDRLILWSIYGVAGYLSYLLLIEPGDTWIGVAAIAGVVVVVFLVYTIILGVSSTSPGMAAVGIRVVGAQAGGPIGFGRAFVRQLILAIATLPTFGLGVATLAWTAVMDPSGRRRGWHDRVGRSAVVDIRPEPVVEPEPEVGPRAVVNLTAMRLVPAPQPALPTPSRAPRTAPVVEPPVVEPPVVEPPVVEAPRPSAPRAPVETPQPRPAPPAPTHRAPTPTPTPTPAPTPTPTPTPAPQPRPRTSSSTQERTIVRGGGQGGPSQWRVTFDSGESFVVEGLVLLGRRPEPRAGESVRHLVPLQSADMSLSKTHAQLQVAADGVLVAMDRGSTNGSVLIREGVARELVAGRPTTLLRGDLVRFGDRQMTVATEPQAFRSDSRR